MIRGLLVALAALVVLLALGWLALRRPDIPYAELERRYATPATRYADLPGGVRMAYREEGRADGPTLVLVHGYSASAADWDGWAARLGGRFRIVAPDLPGHGLTRSPPGYAASDARFVSDLDALATALKLPPFVLAGNSMGGGVAWRYALAHPERVKGLVLVDAAGFPPPASPGKGPLIFRLLKNPIARAVVRDLDTTRLVRSGLQDAFLDKRLVTDAVVRRYTDLARAPGHRDILLALQANPRDAATPGRLAAIRAPTLVMWGAEDRLIPVSDADRFAAAVPGAEKIVYPAVGHVPMEQIPDRSADDLLAWARAHGLGG